jgi:hypothetical protein
MSDCFERKRSAVRRSWVGKSAHGDEARMIRWSHGRSGDGIVAKLVVLTHGDLPGSAQSGSP